MDAPAPAHPSLQRSEIYVIIAGLLVAMLLAALDQTIVATAMPTIGRDLGDVEHLPWIVTAYLLAATAVTPLYGKLSDIHGRRIMLLVSISTFLVGSICCALAPTMLLLGVARGLQGIGGGGLISLSQTIIGDIVTPRERPRYQVMIASVFVVASLAGPLLGGFFAEHLHWSMIFWINVPIGLVAFSMTFVLLKRLPRHERRHKLDIAGATLLIAATTSLLLTLNWGGVRYPWLSPPLIGMTALSGLFWVLFVARLRTAAEPLIPLAVLSHNVMACGTIAASCSMGLFIGLSIYMPIYFEGVVGLAADQSGLALMPLMIGTVIGATAAGRAMVNLVHYKRVPLCGLAAACIVACALASNPAGYPLPVLALMLGVVSMGLGTVLSVSTISIQNTVALHQLGTALASMNLFRQLGGALLVAVFGAIVIGSGGNIGRTPDTTSLQAATQASDALVTAFRLVFLVVAAGTVVGFFAIRAMEERPLSDVLVGEVPALGE